MRDDTARLAGLDDHELSAELADRSGRLLLELRGGGLEGKALGKEGDLRSNDALLEALDHARPRDAVLSEESVDDPARLAAERVWIIDPLDGTREYGEPGRSDWAVHVALWQAGHLVAGAVGLPDLGRVLSTARPPAVPPAPPGGPRVVVSRSRAPEFLAQAVGRAGGTVLPMGSAGAKTGALLLGEADAYLHAGGQYEWDSAAPVAVAVSAGLHASRLDGSPLRYNRPDPLLPDLMICRPELVDRLSAALAGTAGAPGGIASRTGQDPDGGGEGTPLPGRTEEAHP